MPGRHQDPHVIGGAGTDAGSAFIPWLQQVLSPAQSWASCLPQRQLSCFSGRAPACALDVCTFRALCDLCSTYAHPRSRAQMRLPTRGLAPAARKQCHKHTHTLVWACTSLAAHERARPQTGPDICSPRVAHYTHACPQAHAALSMRSSPARTCPNAGFDTCSPRAGARVHITCAALGV